MAKKTNRPIEITLINTQSWLDYTYEDYLEFCKDAEIEPAEEDSYEFHQWTYDQSNLYFECDSENIKACKAYQYAKFVITGNLDLWNGRPSVVPEKVTGLWNAIKNCFGTCDDLIVTLNTKTGVIDVQAMHHDGTNCFEIRMLRDYCNDAYNRAYDEYWYGEDEEFQLKRGWFQKIPNLYAV